MNLISLHSAPRSGSTWLQYIFESHPNIKTILQPMFSYKFKNIITKDTTKDEFCNFIEQLESTEDEFCNLKSDLHRSNNIFDLKKEKIKHIFMKNCHHHHLIEQMIELYPNIKIIGLTRNPESVIYSQMNSSEKLKDWLNGEDKNENRIENFFGFNKWLEIEELFKKIKHKYKNNIILIKYETIVENPVEEIKKICSFCNIDYHDNMEYAIKLMKSKHDNSDYSVFKNEDTINKYSSKLEPEIYNYINKSNKTYYRNIIENVTKYNNQEPYKNIYLYVEQCFKDKGDSHEGVGWPDHMLTIKRYKVMLDILNYSEKNKTYTLLDFGCGLGGLYQYILDNNMNNINYEGLEISKLLFEQIKKKYTNVNFHNLNILEDTFQNKYDFIIINGVFTSKPGMNDEEMWDFFTNMIKRIYDNINIGVSFNIMSPVVDYKEDFLFYLSYDKLSFFLKNNFNKNFIINQAYGGWEYTVYLFKNPI